MFTYIPNKLPNALTVLMLVFAGNPDLQAAAFTDGRDSFPVHRPLTNLHEAAAQNVGRDGPRYPDEGFLQSVRACRAQNTLQSATERDETQMQSRDCHGGFAILTMANDVAMETLVPFLLESLQRLEHPSLGDTPDDLARHTTVVAVTPEASQSCVRLRRRYHQTCTVDSASGLYDGDNQYPDHKALAFGMAKLKYIVNALTTDTAILYVDADVVFLRNPFPELLSLTADIAVATAPEPCGSLHTETEAELDDEEESADDDEQILDSAGQGSDVASTQRRRRLQDGEGSLMVEDISTVRFSTGLTFYRSTPGVLRCAYSLLLDMSTLATADPNATVWEQERFAAFMPVCASALRLGLEILPADRYLTSCGENVSDAGRKDAVAVHVSGRAGSWLKDRAPLMQSLLGIEPD